MTDEEIEKEYGFKPNQAERDWINGLNNNSSDFEKNFLKSQTVKCGKKIMIVQNRLSGVDRTMDAMISILGDNWYYEDENGNKVFKKDLQFRNRKDD